MNQNDRRVLRTQKYLKDALAEIMLKKDLHQITIDELTKKADIHRATFYMHYQDIYDLYYTIEDELINSLKDIEMADEFASYEDIYIALTDYIYQHAPLIKMLLGKTSERGFQEKIEGILRENYLAIWVSEEKQKTVTPEMFYLVSYHIQGCIAIIRYWIEHDFQFSKHHVVELLRKVNENFEQISI